MPQFIQMPKLGLASNTSLIGNWFKKRGEFVKKGEVLVTVETDKSVFEVESEHEGYILEILYSEGDEVEVLKPIAVIGEQHETYEVSHEMISEQIPRDTKQIKHQQAVVTDELQSTDLANRIKISPRARHAANKRQIPIDTLTGSGPNNRVVERDVIEQDFKTQERQATLLPHEQSFVEMSNMRKVIAKNMVQSLQNAAQLTLNTSFDATAIIAFRKKLKVQKNVELQQISMNEMLLFAVSRVLKKHSLLNAHIDGTKISPFNRVHLGVAIDLPRGLIVPTLFDADTLGLLEMSKTMKTIYEKCKTNAILPHELQGASFTVTNLGALGIESFTPIINPPQVGILGVCKMDYKVKVIGEEPVYYPAIPLSLTFDHRALDGAPAARFLQELVNGLENFDVLMAQ